MNAMVDVFAVMLSRDQHGNYSVVAGFKRNPPTFSEDSRKSGELCGEVVIAKHLRMK